MSATPRPWYAVWEALDAQNQPLCTGIQGANGEDIVKTDGGYYPPGPEDAKLIVRAVNAFEALLAVAKAVTHLRIQCQPGEYHYCPKCDQNQLHVQHATWCPIAALDAAHPDWRTWP
jgi:hypothetical protein